MSADTLFLRLEGPLQAWGNHESKFVVRRTNEAPTKSGIFGLFCAAMGVSRLEAAQKWLPQLAGLRMGVRIDQPGVRWWDYHTVGAEMKMRTAEGKTKPGAMLTRREFLCDASFLVALQGAPGLIETLYTTMQNPRWALFLGRKSCPASRPMLEHQPGEFGNTETALTSVPWRKRYKNDPVPEKVDCLLDWQPTPAQPEAPNDAQVWYDVPVSFDPPAHTPRFVIRKSIRTGVNGEIGISETPAQNYTPPPPRPRADYQNTAYRKARAERIEADRGLCVFCKSPATTVQHITYRRAGGNESHADLRSLCRLCHDAVTMIEYGVGMGLDRIDPCEPRWRKKITKKRSEIIEFRSLETRRRRLNAEEVE